MYFECGMLNEGKYNPLAAAEVKRAGGEIRFLAKVYLRYQFSQDNSSRLSRAIGR